MKEEVEISLEHRLEYPYTISYEENGIRTSIGITLNSVMTDREAEIITAILTGKKNRQINASAPPTKPIHKKDDEIPIPFKRTQKR